MYYVISLRHTHSKDKFLTLWAPNNAGYCYSKDRAGIYEIPEKGYHDSEGNMPILISDAEKLMKEVEYYGEMKFMIPNTPAIRRQLNVKYLKGDLVKLNS